MTSVDHSHEESDKALQQVATLQLTKSGVISGKPLKRYLRELYKVSKVYI